MQFPVVGDYAIFRGAGLGLLAILVAAVIAYGFVHPPSGTTGGEDFAAFYCGAQALADGKNPYQYSSLRPCEIANVRFDIPSAVVPAPLPPYGLTTFRALAWLPFAQASFIWWLLLLASTFVIIWAITELAKAPLWLVGLAIAAAVLSQALPSRALAPLPIALLCGAAVALAKHKWNAVAMLIAGAFIEPHMAFPVALVTFVLVPALRLRLALVLCAIAAISLTSGVALNWEYLTAVVPAQASSEISFPGQYGLSFLLHAVGVSESLAIALGGAQYVAFIFLGLWLARRLHSSVKGSIIFAPMACAVTGGPYIHFQQVTAILPLAFVVATHYRAIVGWVGVGLLSIPWQSLLPIGIAPIVAPPVSPHELAEAAWKALAEQVHPSAWSWFGHGLTYAGIACVYWSAVRLACASESTPQVREPARDTWVKTLS